MESAALPMVPLPVADISALIFDLDGTLLDTMTANRKALAATFAHYGVQSADLPRVPEGTGFADWCRVLIQRGLLPADVSMPSLQAICDQEVHSAYQEVTEIAVVANRARWAHGRFRTAVATGSNRSIVDILLGRTGLRNLFDVVVTRDDVARGKPAPDLFLRAAALLAVPPGRCVVFEDTEIGLAAARSAGMTPVDIRGYRDTGPAAR